ncbi:homoserine O-acetyltransferase/O-succinyltransferase family protein [Francisella uliginis]|uniref:Homoserine O-acetyltransferase n=1 Tax=Francisella uliginis TaxID=573570 RepID=A0A1L4BTY5_9GAMM|nr:homoserine O-succinyltransferase [Francisella uliginis]API87310.1 homoserine O-succinyltransferase [Francisella uliginis]
MTVNVKKSFNYFSDLKVNFSNQISFKSTGIKHLRIAVVNLMPTVKETEKQWKDVLSQNSSTIVDFVFFHSLVRPSTRVQKSHLEKNYSNWQDYDFAELDGIVITGAPVELLAFEDVDFYEEVCEIITKSLEYDLSVMLVCWAAQAGLNYLYDIQKECLDHKLFGVYEHKPIKHDHPLLKGVEGQLKACVSRQTTIKDNNVLKYTDVILASPIDGLDCLVDKTHKITYMLNHLEYTQATLETEYLRDKAAAENITKPYGYYNDNGNIDYSWQNDRVAFYSNWLDTLKENKS